MRIIAIIITAAIVAGCSASDRRSAQQNAASLASSAPQAAADQTLALTVKGKLILIDADAVNLNVTADHGVVQMTGVIKNGADKPKFDQAARSTSGVNRVVDNIQVNPNAASPRETAGDAALTTKVTAALLAQSGVNALHVKVSAHAGVVTLDGEAASAAVKSVLMQTARATNGVRSVVDKITVK